MMRRFSVVMNAPKVGGRAYARAVQQVKEKRVGMESPVHGLRKVSHNVRHVITSSKVAKPTANDHNIIGTSIGWPMEVPIPAYNNTNIFLKINVTKSKRSL